jgi:hypothetical protein
MRLLTNYTDGNLLYILTTNVSVHLQLEIKLRESKVHSLLRQHITRHERKPSIQAFRRRKKNLKFPQPNPKPDRNHHQLERDRQGHGSNRVETNDQVSIAPAR